jgi:hypothetical protein
MHEDGKVRGAPLIKSLSLLAVIVFIVALLWGSDRITMQGERTIYTVDCDRGTWNGDTCSGALVPGKRYAFRASQSRNEVVYWVRGSTAPSGKYPDCKVIDRDNWSCAAPGDGTPTTIAFAMTKGWPVHAEGFGLLPFHAVPKWKWWLMDVGLRAFTRAEN